MELDSDREDYLNIEENVYTLQDVDCITFVEKYAHPLSSCLECHKGDQDLCRFKNFRRIALSAARVGADLLGGRYTHWKKADSTTPDFLYAKSFTPRISRQDVNYLKASIARVLLPEVKRSSQALNSYQGPVIPMSRSAHYKDICDICDWPLDLVSWICKTCGSFSCLQCPRMTGGCCAADNVLASAMEPEELRDFERQLLDFSLLPVVLPRSHDGKDPGLDSILENTIDPIKRVVPTLHGQCSLGEFNSFWSMGVPLVVKLGGDLQCDWSPISLATLFGSDKCTVVDCEDRGYKEECLVDEFLRVKLPRRQGRILKLKDYPPDTTLKLKSSDLGRDFNSAVPVCEYCSDSGPLNIANYFPINYSCMPDLAMASRQDRRQHGSTRLHMDISDAVNIMANIDGEARWEIFTAEDTKLLGSFIKSRFKKLKKCRAGDSVNAYHVYLTPDHLEVLRVNYKIVPFTFHQSFRDVVYIPAGCAHQVSNITPCVKVAMDFLSPQSLERCFEVDRMFRSCSQATDTLELYNLLIHSWMALTFYETIYCEAQAPILPRLPSVPRIGVTTHAAMATGTVPKPCQSMSAQHDADNEHGVPPMESLCFGEVHSDTTLEDIQPTADTPADQQCRTCPADVANENVPPAMPIPATVALPGLSQPMFTVAPTFTAIFRTSVLGKRKERTCVTCQQKYPDCPGAVLRKRCPFFGT
ncbi:hypothetical protein PC9H_010343 [Pleurotus ostreatus]|uniref:JmjC domain-containing protein n=1 Tax=Pleurotus ostreatus TaxID=5322 RepID=A0A8H7DQZ4_PLEOS|nr:uncharacterized protein PC9H_010343 [Pleurotus ostreatus]KAF7422188.1 hypothetical protein PC9H_010343 [Pleurotus ostreatus]